MNSIQPQLLPKASNSERKNTKERQFIALLAFKTKSETKATHITS